MRTLQQTGSMISISIVARDDDGTLQRLFDVLYILAGQLSAWLNMQLAAEHQRIQIDLLAERMIILATILIKISERVLAVVIWFEYMPTAFLDWCEAVYLESAALWGEVGFLFTGKLQPAYRV